MNRLSLHRRPLFLTGLFSVATCIGVSSLSAQDEVTPGSNTSLLPAMPTSLDALVEHARNGNIKVRQAQHNLEAARSRLTDLTLQVTQAVITVHHQLRKEEETLAAARKMLDIQRALTNQGRASVDEMLEAELAQQKVVQQLEEAKADAKYYLALGDVGQTPDWFPGSLDRMLTEALQRCPSIKIAAAKVDLARLELADLSLQTVRDVTQEYYRLQSKRTIAEQVRIASDRTQQRVQTGTAPNSELLIARNALLDAELEVTRSEAKLRYLLGTSSK